MKRVFLLSFIFSIFIYFPSNSQTVTHQNIFFDSDDFELSESSREILKSLYSGTSDFTESHINIVGHTDQDGSHEYNMALSEKRAQHVKQYLVEQGYPVERVTTSFLGETDLLSQSTDSASKQENRRVTIQVEGYTYTNVSEMVSQLDIEDNDHHTIDPSFDTHLELKKGTEVNIPSNAFCRMDGTPLTDQKVDLLFKEVFEYSDMVDESLFTQTKDQILETGGMIYIEASQNGELLKLQDGKSIELIFPEQEVKDGMELFTGFETEDGMIWEETGEAIQSERGEANMPFIDVDLSPILDLDIDLDNDLSLRFDAMPAFPHPVRKPYYPYKENYTEEEYKEALAKYDALLEKFEQDKLDRPEKLDAWVVEAIRRKEILFAHKKKYMRSQLLDQLKERLAKLEESKDRVSHEKLVNVLFAFFDRNIGKFDYNDWYYTKLAFGDQVVQARKVIDFYFPDYKYVHASYFFPDVTKAVREVQGSIAERKYELGYIDANTMSRYVVAASDLGWINCDKFYEMAEYDKTDMEFARLSKEDRYYLVFKNRRSLIMPNGVADKISFNGVPRGEEVRLVVVNMEEGNARMAVHDFVSTADHGLKLKFVPADIPDLKKAFEI